MRRLAWVLLVVCGFAGDVRGGPPATWLSAGVGGGGGLFAPSFSPHRPDELFVACDMGEQFHTTDGGRSWEVTPFTQLQVEGHSPRVQFTDDPNILYMVDFTGERRRPVKSLDGGRTWRPLRVDPTGGKAWTILADDTDSRRVLVGARLRLYFSGDGGRTFTKKFRSPVGEDLHVAGAFFDGALIAVGTSAGLIVSSDGGRTFAPSPAGGIPPGEAMVSFAGAASGGTTRFFCVTLERGKVTVGVQGNACVHYRGVYALDHGATAWVRRTEGLWTRAKPFFVGMARNNVEVVWVGGGEMHVPLICKTTDGGASWRTVFLAHGNRNIEPGWSGSGGNRDWSYGEFVLGMAVHPRHADRVAFTDCGFIHLTTDGGASWRQAYTTPVAKQRAGARIPGGASYVSAGLENTSVWHVAWADANTMWASCTDIRGIRSADAGRSWGFDYSGFRVNSSYRLVVHPTTGVMYMAGASVHDLYQSRFLSDRRIDGGKGDVFFSTDKGRRWRPLGSIGRPVVYVALHPAKRERLYASVVNSATGGIYVCDDVGAGEQARWTRLAAPPRTEGHPFNVVVLNDGMLVCTYSGRRALRGKRRHFTASSGVFVSSDDGRTWRDRSHPNMRYWTKDITIDPHDPLQDTWYVGVFSGWGGPSDNLGGLYKTVNRGRTWTRLFRNDRVSSCTLDPASRHEMYVTTEVDGLWYSSTLKHPIPTFKPVTSYPFRQPERVIFNPHTPGEIWVTSFGNGMRVGRKQ